MMRQVAALFVTKNSVYKTMPAVDAWDIDRDARLYSGNDPVVAHPPCRSWGGLRQFAKPRPDEKELAIWAVAQVQKNGGVLEHPASSTLWEHCDLPLPGCWVDKHGGQSYCVDQCDWGHLARKRTWLYVCGNGGYLGRMPPKRIPEYVVAPSRSAARGPCKHLPKSQREVTPPLFAEWLVALARNCCL